MFQRDSFDFDGTIFRGKAADVRTESAVYVVVFDCDDQISLRHNLQNFRGIVAVQNVDVRGRDVDSLFLEHIGGVIDPVEDVT